MKLSQICQNYFKIRKNLIYPQQLSYIYTRTAEAIKASLKKTYIWTNLLVILHKQPCSYQRDEVT
jgi:hypothetical protein